MERRLPDALLERKPVEKLVWLYIDRWPGEHSITSLETALGVYAGRALAALVMDGLLIEETAPGARKAGRYRTSPVPCPTPGTARGQFHPRQRRPEDRHTGAAPLAWTAD